MISCEKLRGDAVSYTHLDVYKRQDGEIDKVCSPYPIDKKFEAFNFHTIVIDGNDFDQIRAAFKEARETKGMPTAIIAKTVKGKGCLLYTSAKRRIPLSWSRNHILPSPFFQMH